MAGPNKKTSNTKQHDISRFESLIDDLKRRYPQYSNQLNQQTIAIVSAVDQQLYLIKNQSLEKSYLISTAEVGIGNISGSYQTPLGLHKIAEKFGDNAPIASIFKARKNTQQIADIILDPDIRSDQDNITSRILWLQGLEDGINKGFDKNNNNVDSHSRYIYIHGTDEENLLGKPVSHGCVRMANSDVIELYEKMEINDLVMIIED